MLEPKEIVLNTGNGTTKFVKNQEKGRHFTIQNLGQRVPKDSVAPSDRAGSRSTPPLQSQKLVSEDGQGVPKDSTSRPWIKSRLSSKDADAAEIFEGWEAISKGAPKLAQAIRLLDAIEHGNLDYIKENYPMLPAALGTQSRKRKSTSASPIESESKDSLNTESKEGDALEGAIVDVCKIDPDINRRELDNTLRKFRAARQPYTAAEVRDWNSRIWMMEFPAVKSGEPPKLRDLERGILRVRHLMPLPSQPIGTDGLDPEPPSESHMDEPQGRSALPPGSRDAGHWASVTSGLSVSLNRATYGLWIKPLRPVEVREEEFADVFVIDAPSRHVVEYIMRHLLDTLTSNLTHIRGKTCRIEFEVEGVPYEPSPGPVINPGNRVMRQQLSGSYLPGGHTAMSSPPTHVPLSLR